MSDATHGMYGYVHAYPGEETSNASFRTCSAIAMISRDWRETIIFSRRTDDVGTASGPGSDGSCAEGGDGDPADFEGEDAGAAVARDSVATGSSSFQSHVSSTPVSVNMDSDRE